MAGLRISRKPTVKVLPLIKTDPSGETTVTVAQATQADHIALGEIFAETTQVYDDADTGGKTELKRNLNVESLKMARAFRTVRECNLIDEDTGKPFLTFPTTDFLFESEWGDLSHDIAEDIYAQVIAVNTDWDPKRKGE